MSMESPVGANYQKVFSRVIQGLEAQHIPYMVVGGLAAAYHGVPRATFDIDLVIGIEPRSIRPLVRLLRSLRFDIHLSDAMLLFKIGNQIQTINKNRVRLDLWLIRSEYDREALSRRQRVMLWPGQPAWVVRAEDTILSKLIAGRTKDFEDIIGVLDEQKDRLDWTYINSWAKRLNMSEALQRVKRKHI